MCGRFSLHLPAQSIAEFFMTLNLKEVTPRYNIAPTQAVLAVIKPPREPGNYAFPMRWGLVPSWAKDLKIGQKLTNARSETLSEKPSFRGAYKYRRCLIPAAGFYEWQRDGSRKQPFFITSTSKSPLAMAGLWEHWSGPAGEEIQSCTIITTAANEVMAPIHDRMPVLLAKEHFQTWLAPDLQDTKPFRDLLVPCPDEWLNAYPVSPYVSNYRNEGPRCIEPLAEGDHPQEPTQMELF